MGKEIITFGDIKVEKHKFYRPKNLILLEDIDIKNIHVSNMVSSSKKSYNYFINYKDDDHKIRPLRVMLPETSAFVKVIIEKLNGCVFFYWR